MFSYIPKGFVKAWAVLRGLSHLTELFWMLRCLIRLTVIYIEICAGLMCILHDCMMRRYADADMHVILLLFAIFIKFQHSSIHKQFSCFKFLLRTHDYTGSQWTGAVIKARGVIGRTVLYH